MPLNTHSLQQAKLEPEQPDDDQGREGNPEQPEDKETQTGEEQEGEESKDNPEPEPDEPEDKPPKTVSEWFEHLKKRKLEYTAHDSFHRLTAWYVLTT